MLNLEQLCKTYPGRRGGIQALDHIDLHIRQGEFLVVRGPSGSGKSTLLLTLGGMMRPTGGAVKWDGSDIYALSASRRAQLRAREIGFVFQMFHLIPYLTVLENTQLSCRPGARGSVEEAKALLNRFGLQERILHKPGELSAGEKQRTAIARAMAHKPQLILADEPTGNLDPHNAEEIIHYLADYNREGGTVVMVTHGQQADCFANRVLVLEAGKFIAT